MISLLDEEAFVPNAFTLASVGTDVDLLKSNFVPFSILVPQA